MNIEIAGKNYKIITTDSKHIRLTMQQDGPTIYTPVDIDLHTLEHFVRNNPIQITQPEHVAYSDQPLQLFQQSYLLKIIKNSSSNKILIKNRTITLYSIGHADHQKQLKSWQKKFVLQQISNLISDWEEKLNVLVGTIKLRSIKKKCYTLHPDHSITFSTAVTCLSMAELQYLTFKAIAASFTFSPELIATYFPTEQLLDHQITYSLKTWQPLH